MKQFKNIKRNLLLVTAMVWGLSLQAQLVVSGTDSPINTTTSNTQLHPAAAQAGNGTSFIVWESREQDGDGYGIYGQFQDATGMPMNAEILINTTTAGDQRMADVAMDDAGNAVVAWMDALTDGDAWGVYAQRFTSAGTATGSEFRVNVTTSGVQRKPAVAMNDNGDFVIAWESENTDGDGMGIVARTYDNTGTATSSEILVNDSTTGYQGYADVALDNSGNFAVTWQSQGHDGSGNGVFAKTFSTAGATIASEFAVNTTTAGNQQEPAIGMDGTGNMIFAWSDFEPNNAIYQIKTRRFDLNGNALTAETVVNGSINEAHDHSHVAATVEGSHVISYSAYGRDGAYQGIYAQAYNVNGVAAGSDVVVNTESTQFQQLSGAAWRRDSLAMVITWQSGFHNELATQDGDGYGIFAKLAGNVDVEAPLAVCQDVTVSLDVNGDAVLATADVDAGSSDNIGITSSNLDITNFDCSNLGLNAVVLTLGDAAGNQSSCSSVVTVEDNLAPTAICQDLTLGLGSMGTAMISATGVDNGSSDNCSLTLNIDQASFDCASIGMQVVTLTADDGNGNVSSCASNVTVQDLGAPTANCQDVTVALIGSVATVTASQLDNSSSDNCGIASSSISQSAFDCSDAGINPVTLTVIDVNGNQSTCVANVTVKDQEAPVAICQDITAVLGGNTATVGAAQVDNNSSDNCGIASKTLDQSIFDCSDIGSNSVILTVTDVAGNLSTCTAFVTIQDLENPIANCQDVTLSLNGNNVTLAASQVNNSSSDNCSIASTTISQSVFDCSDIGSNAVNLTVTDASGNTGICTSNVTVQDLEAPIANCQDVTVVLNGNVATVTASQVNNNSSDNCGVASTSISQSTFDCNDVGSNPVTLVVTDVNGNTSSCIANVAIEDNVAPIARCRNRTVNLNAAGAAIVIPSMVDNGSSDDCGSVNLALNKITFGCNNIGNNTVTLTATDQNGNVGQCTANITVRDRMAPLMICPPTMIYSCVANIPTKNVNQVNVIDNCDSNPFVTVSDNANGSGCGVNQYRLARTFTAKDDENNTASCTQQIIVNMPGTISIGSCTFCLAKVKVKQSCSNPASVYITSCEKIKKVKIKDANDVWHEITGLNTKSGTWVHPSGKAIKQVKVKSGCTSNNYSHNFNLCNGSSKAEEEDMIVRSGISHLTLKAFPNPTDGNINIELANHNGLDGEVNVRIVNMQGQVLETKLVQMTEGFHQSAFDLAQYSSGLYYIIVDDGNQRLTEKIVKQ